MKGLKKGLGIYLILFFAMFCGVIWYVNKNSKADDGYTIVDFQAEVSEGLIGSVEIYQNKEIPTGTVYITYRQTNEEKEFNVSDVNQVQRIVQNKGDGNIRMELHDISGQSNVWTWLPTVVLIVVLLVVVMIFMANMSGAGGGGGAGGGKMMNFGKSRAHMSNENDQKYTFKDVAGLEEEKEDMAEIVDFLRNPKKYNTLGARIPKGVLLEGPPGTGKTLLAKAVAGEAGVPFFTISGSDFVEMFVGVGASRVRDLFEDAKKNAPCIIFIDEIDAVARKRGSGLGGGHDEREQTLNQMLVEMDGFGTNEGIIVLAATNRVDILDPAILRPGRFDRKVMVGRPDVKGREEILRVHVRNKPLSDDIDLHEIARTTAGFAGADLENLMNEAAICAAKQNRQFIKKEDVDKSFVKIGIGGEKKSRLVPEKERRITAYHESGHAILFHLLSEVGPVHLVSIIPNGRGAGGYTMPLPENDNVFMTKKHMLQDIMVSFGGRIAEELIFGDITTGASADIKQATQTAQAMVVKYGMSEKVGLINYEVNSEEEVFLGRDLGHARNYSEKVAAMIDKEVRRIMDECYLEAKQIIVSHMDVLHRCAAALLEKERINRAEFEALFEESPTETYPDGLDTTGLNQ
ncbi:ATP-dependent zinc metalloprotease FtsH [Eubacterium sp. MSJ-33]|uniref:ATP-dependent zinc metalloprotease FtsH n=1 Tax=Eubacterium sp. MSJ-33 TaxID=2841528 RepID=UPI001C75C97D|nr:ATP-dependent zinc metalloprotease FtsH [Eubacterium sp. MSJ-33]QWT52510.1 ATP-dependent zinc metalloprotease FtsH [Eubacterium sp. MSJ-33]